jgi:hypothetical protein
MSDESMTMQEDRNLLSLSFWRDPARLACPSIRLQPMPGMFRIGISRHYYAVKTPKTEESNRRQHGYPE